MSVDPTRLPFLAALYEQYLEDQDAAAYSHKVARSYTQGTLERLSEHAYPKVRRAAVLALGFSADYSVNAVLGRALVDEDRTVRMLADEGIRHVWARAGAAEHQHALAIIIRLNAAQHYREAADRATQLIAAAPGYAEAWNQRAIARFGMRQYLEAIADCHQTLEINPYHFAAAAGMGQAYMQLGDAASALDSFRHALRLNRDLEGARVQVAKLTRLLEGK